MRKPLKVISALLLVVVLAVPLLVTTPMLADSTGSHDAGTGADGGGGDASWTGPGNIATPGSPYASCIIAKQEYSNFLNATNYGFNIPSHAVIYGIEVNINRKCDDSSDDINDYVVQLIKDGNRVGDNKAATSIDWLNSFSTKYYGGTVDLWGTDWTYEDINSSDFGVSLQVYNSDTVDTNTAMVDFIKVTVHYYLCFSTITVEKVTVPTPDPTDTSFNFTVVGENYSSSFSLKNCEHNDLIDIPIGSYNITEEVPDCWDLDVVCTCDNYTAITDGVALELPCGENITCTFINNKTEPVGGEAYPINKIAMLAPWIALAIVIAAGGFYVVRRRAQGYK